MKLYSLIGAESITDGEIEYTASKDGSIEVPEEFGRFIHNIHVAGKPAWEDDAERQKRIDEEDHAKKSDPAYLANIVEDLSEKVEAAVTKKTSTKAIAKALDAEASE